MDKKIEKIEERMNDLEQSMARLRRYFEEVLCSLDESNFSADFLNRLKKSTETE